MEEIGIIICLKTKTKIKKIIVRLRSFNLVVNKIVFKLYRFNSVYYDLVMHH